MERVPGHSSVLHKSVSSSTEHAAPPFFASWMTSRVLVLLPPPQVTLQSPHADQSPTLQSTGDPQFSKDVMMKIRKQDEESTWTIFSVALFRFLKIRARSSCILCFSDHLPSSLLASTAASHTAFAPRLPIANFAVNWNCKALVRNSRATMATMIA